MNRAKQNANENESRSQQGRRGSIWHVEAGIYRTLDSGTYFERPKVRGKRTWRSLETKNLKHAREELHQRRSGLKVIEAETMRHL